MKKPGLKKKKSAPEERAELSGYTLRQLLVMYFSQRWHITSLRGRVQKRGRQYRYLRQALQAAIRILNAAGRQTIYRS